MNRMPRPVAACLAAAAAAVVMSAPVRAQEPPPADARPDDARPSPGDAPPPLPSVAVQGWRLGGNFFAGYDTNATDIPGGPGSSELDLGGFGGAGRRGRFSTLEGRFDGGRRQYPGIDGRSGWRGSAGATAARRLSKMSVASIELGYQYDFTDGFPMPGVATQLPRTTVHGRFAEGRFAWKPIRRWLWSNLGRYEALDFDPESGLVDTRTVRARTELERQVSRLDFVGPRYEFMRTEWGPRSSDVHSILGGWRHGAQEVRWGWDVEAGAVRAVAPLPGGGQAQWRFSGRAGTTYRTTRTTFELQLRQGVSPGYGQGRLLDTKSAQASAQYYITRTVSARLTGAVDRSSDNYDPVYGHQKGAYLDVELAGRVAGWVGFVASYRFRTRDSFGAQTTGNRFGLSLTSEIRSSRVRTGVGVQGQR
jgi:hypothetical protein